MARFGGSPHHRATRLDRFQAVSVFSDLWVSERKDDFAVQFQYNIPSDEVVVTTDATGTVTQDDSMAIVQTGTGQFATAGVRSRKPLRYLPGHECYGLFTAIFTVTGEPGSQVGIDGTEQLCGMFDSMEGYYIGFQGEEFFVARRKDGQEFRTLQSEFNQDNLTGEGGSLSCPDFTKLNVFRIRFGWLGAAIISFEIMRPQGDWLEFHRLLTPGALEGTTIGNPVLPMRFFADNGDTEQNITMKTGSWNGGRIGGDANRANRYQSFGNQKLVDPNVLTSIFQLRSAEEFHGRPNRVLVKLLFISAATNANNLATIRILKDSTVTGENFSTLDPENSVISVDTAGGEVTEIGDEIFLFGVARASSEAVDISEMQILIERGDQFTFAIMQPSENQSLIAVRWHEEF